MRILKTSLSLIILGFLPSLYAAEHCEKLALEPFEEKVSVCTKCFEYDSGACVGYEFTQCYTYEGARKKELKCSEVTCGYAPKDCDIYSSHNGSNAYQAVQGQRTKCANGVTRVCFEGAWEMVY